MNSFSFEDKDPRFTRLKPGLALRLLSKGLFYIKAMFESTIFEKVKGGRYLKEILILNSFSFEDMDSRFTRLYKGYVRSQLIKFISEQKYSKGGKSSN